MDEDGFLRQRGTEIFEYNSKGGNYHANTLNMTEQRTDLHPCKTICSRTNLGLYCRASFLQQRCHNLFFCLISGLLVRVYSKAASWTIQYRYDGLGRRVASRNSMGQHLQFFYADLNYPTRITHVYNHSSSEITSFYYDLQVAAVVC